MKIFEILPKTGPVVAAAFSPDSKLIAGLTSQGTIEVWSVDRASPVHELSCGREGKTAGALAFSPTGAYLGTAYGQVVKVWDVRTGEPVIQCRLSDETNSDMAYLVFNASETEVAVANHDNIDYCGQAALVSFTNDVVELTFEAMFLSLTARHEEFVAELYSSVISCEHFGFIDRRLQVLNLTTSQTEGELDLLDSDLLGGPVRCPNGSLAAIGHNSFGPHIEVVAFDSGERQYSNPLPDMTQPGIMFSPDSRFLVWADRSLIRHTDWNHVHIHDAPSGDLVTELRVPGTMHFFCYSPCGRMLAVWPYSNSPLVLFDTHSYQRLATIECTGRKYNFSPDSSCFVCAGEVLTLVHWTL